MIIYQESKVIRILKAFSLTSISILLLGLLSTKSTAQENISKDQDRPLELKIDVIEKEPQFLGGVNKFYKFVGKNYKVPEEVMKKKIGVKVYMQFIVEKDGTLSEIKALEDIGYGSGEEAVRILKLSPKWIPASNKGLPVRVLYKLPITLTPAS